MNPARYIHRVDVQRRVLTVDPTTGKETRTLQAVLTAVPTLIEGLHSRFKESVLGRIPTARFQMSWGLQDIRETDTIVWNGQNFIIREVIADTTRPTTPYHTGVLEGKQVS